MTPRHPGRAARPARQPLAQCDAAVRTGSSGCWCSPSSRQLPPHSGLAVAGERLSRSGVPQCIQSGEQAADDRPRDSGPDGERHLSTEQETMSSGGSPLDLEEAPGGAW